ncbi:MAG: flagellar filament capping protein FliD, partial [Kineothrix sp.]|nr:flagellar filament capping protein FliD [Kineothrix sp.]
SEDEKKAAIAKDVSSRLNEYISQREELLKEQKKQQDSLAEKKAAFSTEYGEDIETVDKDDLKQKIDDLKTKIEDAGESATEADKEELAKLQGKMSAVEQYESQQKELDEVTKNIADVESYLDLSDSANITAGSKLQTEVEAAWESKIKTATDIVNVGIDNLKLQQSKVGKVDGQDAHITLNGVDYYGENNTFEVNGLTITALQESSEEITMTTRRDTDGVYNMIKGFLKEYNALMNEMDKLYNAEATKDYEPLTDEEKKELSDSDVEKWEAKIKDSILRRDSNLSTISSAMKNVMLQGAVVNGKQMYLSNFGIETLGYFSAAENERNAYHINGDEDDAAVSSKDNDLKAAIAADPDTVIAFFSQLSQNLYTELDKQSRSVDGVRSFGSFYDDKRMQDDYNDYKEKIKKQESKLTAMEDKWYKKFSAMETAMAKMQSNQSAVSSLLGGM